MQGFATLVSLATLALSVFVAVRLGMAAWRTRGAPEIAMGVYQILVVAAIALYAALRGHFDARNYEGAFPWVVLANFLIALGVVSLAIGINRIYRADQGWATGLCVALSAWVLGGCVWTALGDVLPTTIAATPANAFFVSGRSAVYFWGAFEGIRYSQMLRKRASLGLGDPVVAHQILLWGCFSLTMGALAISSLSVGWVLGERYENYVLVQFITPTASLVASICLWLGFFPPAAYRRWIAAGHAPAAA